MITSERDWKHRMTVYSVRCDSCSYERAVHVYDRIGGDDGPIREEDLRRQGGVSWVDGKWDLCAACYAKPAISSSWDVRDGEVRRSVPGTTTTEHDTVVYVGDDWLDTPAKAKSRAQHAAEKARAEARLKAAEVAETNRRLRAATEQVRLQAEAWRQYEIERLRAAMAGMANVMHGVAIALDHLNDAFENMRDDNELRNTLFLDSRATRSAVSAEWSRRVREGVAKLQPPGPRVYCASEED